MNERYEISNQEIDDIKEFLLLPNEVKALVLIELTRKLGKKSEG